REEAVGDATLVEHLNGAGVKTPGSRPIEIWLARRSTTTTSMPANASSPANVSPVGPPPAISTACSVIAAPRLNQRVMISTFGSLAASPLPRVMLSMAARVHARRCRASWSGGQIGRAGFRPGGDVRVLVHGHRG